MTILSLLAPSILTGCVMDCPNCVTTDQLDQAVADGVEAALADRGCLTEESAAGLYLTPEEADASYASVAYVAGVVGGLATVDYVDSAIETCATDEDIAAVNTELALVGTDVAAISASAVDHESRLASLEDADLDGRVTALEDIDAEGRLSAIEADYLTSSSLSGYATESWVTGRGFAVQADVDTSIIANNVYYYDRTTSDARYGSSADAIPGLASYVSVNAAGDVVFEGTNLILRSGSGATDGAVNGLGNLIVGYDESVGTETRTGSHNLVIGEYHEWTSYGGIVTGDTNELLAPFAAAIGGHGNSASAAGSAVVGGDDNEAGGFLATVVGGEAGVASGDYSAVVAGQGATASGDYSATLTGLYATASGAHSATVAGFRPAAAGAYDAAIGGDQITSDGGSGGVAIGGYANHNSGGGGVIVGGWGGSTDYNSAYATYPVVVGGRAGSIGVSTNCSVLVGGANSSVAGEYAVQVGGSYQTCTDGDYQACVE